MADPINYSPPDELPPQAPNVPKPDVALPAAPPYPAGVSSPAPAGFDSAPPVPPPNGAAGAERDIATITTLQRRTDELATEQLHHGSDALAFAAAAAAALAAGGRSPGGDVERARAPERGSPAERQRLENQARQDQVTVATIADASANVPNAVATDEIMGAAIDLYDDAHGLSQSTNPFDDFTVGDGDDPSLDAAPAFAPDGSAFAPDGSALADPGRRGAGPAEVGIAHAGATPWNGQTSIGTISHVDGDRAEQYAGRGSWTSFSIANDLGGVTPTVGQSVQINGDGTMQATPEQQLAQNQSLQMDRSRTLS